jgi:hypothetical protein
MGYVLRLTEENGYETPSWILKMAGLEYRQLHHSCAFLFKRSAGLKTLAQVAGVGGAELEQLTYPRDINSSLCRFFDQPVMQYAIRPAHPKVCPACLSESPYCRRVWELSLVTACPLHGRLLIDECPKCGRRLSWIRERVSICPCKFDWREALAVPVGESQLSLTRQVHRLCGLLAGDERRLRSDERNPLSVLGLQDLLSAVVFIAGQYEGVTGVTGKHLMTAGKTARKNSSLHPVLVRAYSTFQDWPNNYSEFLDWRRTQDGNITPKDRELRTGIRKEFGKFYTGLNRYLPGNQFDFLRGAFAEYLGSRWDGGHVSNLNRGRRTSRDKNSIGRYVSRNEARRLLETDHAWVDRFIEAGRLKAMVRDAGKKRLCLIDLNSLKELKRELDQLLSTEEACHRLGMGRDRLMTLVRSGRLLPERGPSVDGFAEWKFTRASVDELL